MRAVTVTVDEPDEGGAIVRAPGLATSVKSVTETETVTEWDRTPLLPVTVTV